MHRFPRALAAATALMSSISACATYPNQMPVVTAETAPSLSLNEARSGTIRMDLSHLFGNASQRKLLDYGLAADQITHVRLRIQGPGQSTPTLLTPTPVPLDTSGPLNKTVECTVTAGPNQVVTVEALDASGVMLMRLRSATNVPSSGVATIHVSILQDSVARVIERLINDRAAFLDSPALIGPLTTFMSNLAIRLNTVPQYIEERQVVSENFSTWDDGAGETIWNSIDSVLAWLAAPESLSMVGTLYSPHSTHALALNLLAPPNEFDSEAYDPTEWKATLIAPTQGVWNAYEDAPFEFINSGSGVFLQDGPGYYLKVKGMPPGKFTLLLTHPTNDTKLVFDLTSGIDEAFFFDPMPRMELPPGFPPPLCGEGSEGLCLPPL